MKKLIICFLLIGFILIGCSNTVTLAEAFKVEKYGYNDISKLEELIAEQETYMQAAHDMANAGRLLGYEETHDIIVLAKQEYSDALSQKEKYQNIINSLNDHWKQKEQEYPYATYIWSYLKDLGYNDYVCAGILGNIMSECGGGTLQLQPLVKGTYYGICQWSKGYKDVWGRDLKGQCDFLRDTIAYELNTYGYVYKKGFNYNTFLSLQSPQQAALAFAKSYERCSSKGYKARQDNAITAYNYFVS